MRRVYSTAFPASHAPGISNQSVSDPGASIGSVQLMSFLIRSADVVHEISHMISCRRIVRLPTARITARGSLRIGIASGGSRTSRLLTSPSFEISNDRIKRIRRTTKEIRNLIMKNGAKTWRTRTARTPAAPVRSNRDRRSREQMRITAVTTVHRPAQRGRVSVCAAIRIARQQE
jgi:hypothetical protein